MKFFIECDMIVQEVIEIWWDEIGEIEGVDQIIFEVEWGFGGWQQDISVDLSYEDVAVLEKASQDFFNWMEFFIVICDVNDNYNKGKQQLDFKLLLEGCNFGLIFNEVGWQVRNVFFGVLVLWQFWGMNEIEVWVKLLEVECKDMYNLEDFLVWSLAGMEVLLMDVAWVEEMEVFIFINWRDVCCIVMVGMDVEFFNVVICVLEFIQEEVLL